MAVEFTIAATISEKFSNLIKKDKYEPCLCELMNLSTAVFPGSYQRILEQPSNECDFLEIGTGTKFDAKLPFEKKHGKLIGSEKQRDFTKWLMLMQQQEYEFGEDIVASRGKNVASMELYKILSHRLENVEAEENVIFFFPYPVVLDSQEFEFMHFVSDFLDAIYRELKKNGLVGCRNIYVIYPAVDGNIVLRCLNSNKREFLRYSGFDEYITYSLKP